MISNLLDELEPMIAAIASEYGRKGHIHGADASDFSQELRIWVIENEDHVREWLDPEVYSPEHGQRMLAKALRNESKDYLLDIKAQATGYERQDLCWYEANELKHLLPCVFDEAKWLEPPQSEGRTNKSQAEGNNWVATLADVARAYGQLGPEDKDLLAAFHRDDWTNKMMAEYHEVSEQVMSYRHSMAIKRLQRVLGGQKPRLRPQTSRDPWRGRRAVSTASMRTYAQKVYDGD